MSILVTGGAGFIGSHTCVELLNAGYEVVVVDNLYNASEKALERVEQITGKKVTFYEADILDRDALNAIFDKEQVESVIHFAGYKAVGESVRKPIEYYYNNITGTLILCDVMRKHNVKNIVFSSSATVYGDPAFIPITEECPKGKITNPYGQTKGMLEQVLTDIFVSDPEWRGGAASVLQSHRRSQERSHRRGSEGHSEQPGSLCGAGSHRQAEVSGRLRK